MFSYQYHVQRDYYENGNLKSEVPSFIAEDGGDCIVHGIVKGYYESGKLEYEAPHINGKQNGITKAFFEKGMLMCETPFKDGKTDGVVKRYFENGNLEYEIPYKNGEIDGVEKVYYENGQLYKEIPYKNGERNGVAKAYYENGQLYKEIPYKNGERNGSTKHYYENGKLKSETPYKGVENGGFIVERKEFPGGRLGWAAFCGGIVSGGQVGVDYFWGAFVVGLILQMVFCYIPILIALNRDCKHKNGIYNLATIFPITIFVIIAIIWAIFDKKEPGKKARCLLDTKQKVSKIEKNSKL